MKLDILGTLYSVTKKKYSDDEAFGRSKIDGYCNNWTHEIVHCDMTTYPDWEHEDAATIEQAEKETLRHEIVHAFLSESGLEHSANAIDGPWSKNEEMVDWFALQGPKICKAWKDANAI